MGPLQSIGYRNRRPGGQEASSSGRRPQRGVGRAARPASVTTANRPIRSPFCTCTRAIARLSAQYHTRWHAIGVPADDDQTFVAATAVAGDSEIHHLTGGTHHSLAIRLGDGVVVIEPPLNEARSKAVLAKVEELWAGLPVTHLILTHHHYDHIGAVQGTGHDRSTRCRIGSNARRTCGFESHRLRFIAQRLTTAFATEASEPSRARPGGPRR